MSEHKFPTEVIDLPSRGKVYPKDSPLADGKIEIKMSDLLIKDSHEEFSGRFCTQSFKISIFKLFFLTSINSNDIFAIFIQSIAFFTVLQFFMPYNLNNLNTS